MGLLANSVYIVIFASFLIYSILGGADESGENVDQLYTSIQLLLILLASTSGGFLGAKLYSPDKDLDMGNDKLTFFGVRWLHYLWILPFIFCSFLNSVIIIIYAGFLTLLADLYFAIRPSLWFNITWWIYFFIIPSLVLGAALIIFRGFIRFYEVMQYKNAESRGWKKFGQVFLYGIGAPTLSCALAGC